MSSKTEKRRRLYEGFGVLDEQLTLEKADNSTIGQQLDSNKTAIGQSLDSNRTVIGQQLDSNWIAEKNITTSITPAEIVKILPDSNSIRQQLDSNKTVIGQSLDSNKTVIGQQLDSKHESKPAIRQQLDSNKTVIGQSLDSNWIVDRTVIGQQLDSNKTVIGQSLDSNKTVIGQQLDSNKPVSLFEIVGDERGFLLYIFKLLEFEANRQTQPITTEVLKNIFNKNSNRIKNLIARLVNKEVLHVTKSGRGNASWRIFSIPEKTFKEIRDLRLISQPLDSNWTAIRQQLDSNKTAIRQQLDSNWIADRTVDKIAEGPCSSSSILINTTTTQIPENLSKVISQKEAQEFIDKRVISEEDLRLSLEHFSYDFEKGLVKSQNPIRLFFGVIRSGKAYKSTKLIEEEVAELKNHQAEVDKMEAELMKLKESQLQAKWKAFKTSAEYGDFFEDVRAKYPHLKDSGIETAVFTEFRIRSTNQ